MISAPTMVKSYPFSVSLSTPRIYKEGNMNINTTQLPYILSIASTGSLSAASRKLGVSQPSLSEYLSGIEKEAGTPLFIRRKRKLYPTAAGQLYLTAAQDILALMEHTKNSIAQLDSEQKVLRVGTGHDRGAKLLAELYPEMNRVFPRLQIENREGFCGDLKDLVRSRVIDIAINCQIGHESSSLNVIPIHDEEIILAMPEYMVPGEPNVDPTNLPFVNFKDYENSVFILPARQSAVYELAETIFARCDMRPSEIHFATSTTMQAAMIRAGCGIGLLPIDYVQPGMGLTFARLRQAIPQTVAFFTRKNHELSDVERYLIFAVLKDRISQHKAITWNALFRSLMWQYDPSLARSLHLEETN